MNSRYPAIDPGHEAAETAIVYIRAVAVDTLPDALRAEVGDLDVIYSVHRGNGDRLALVANRKLAFDLARQHDFAPVNVH